MALVHSGAPPHRSAGPQGTLSFEAVTALAGEGGTGFPLEEKVKEEWQMGSPVNFGLWQGLAACLTGLSHHAHS